MPSDKSLEAMGAVIGWSTDTIPAASVADRLVAEAVTEERQRILSTLVDEWIACEHDDPNECETVIREMPCIVRAIVNGTDQQ